MSLDYKVTDNFTKVLNRHTFKAGIVYQKDRTDQNNWGGTATNGSFNFGLDSANPGDYNYQFANLAQAISTRSRRPRRTPMGRWVYNQARVVFYGHLEGEAEPDPGLGRALQLILQGGRITTPMGQSATFNPALWNPSQAVKLYGYAPSGKAVNPLTGALVPLVHAGADRTWFGQHRQWILGYRAKRHSASI